jgi:hypothetical protein
MGTTTPRGRKPEQALADRDDVEMEEIRRYVREMPDTELLRFGMTAKFLCSLEATVDLPPPERVRLRLTEAQAEWERRNPGLPLNPSLMS